jgi:hypothetical protein
MQEAEWPSLTTGVPSLMTIPSGFMAEPQEENC